MITATELERLKVQVDKAVLNGDLRRPNWRSHLPLIEVYRRSGTYKGQWLPARFWGYRDVPARLIQRTYTKNGRTVHTNTHVPAKRVVAVYCPGAKRRSEVATEDVRLPCHVKGDPLTMAAAADWLDDQGYHDAAQALRTAFRINLTADPVPATEAAP